MESEPSRLIAIAAKKHLSPLGFLRKGRSRLWLADHAFWLTVVEFQPSGFSAGSYLNVGACWLWRVSDFYSFDHGYRADVPFVEYESASQFHLKIEQLANRAVDEAKSLRDKFNSIRQIADGLAKSHGQDPHRLLHAAIANGLAGSHEVATALFGEIAGQSAEHDWHRALMGESALLAATVSDRNSFVTTIRKRVNECRALKRLPAVVDCFDTAS